MLHFYVETHIAHLAACSDPTTCMMSTNNTVQIQIIKISFNMINPNKKLIEICNNKRKVTPGIIVFVYVSTQ